MRRARGYTLIEVIVAFAILALGLSYLLGTLSGASRQVRDAGDAGRAALHADSVLETYGNVPKEGSHAGEFEGGRYRWRLTVTPWQDSTPRAGPRRTDPNGPRMMQLQLEIKWGDGGPRHRLQLSSLRLVQPALGASALP